MIKLSYIKDIIVAKIVRRFKFEVALGGALSAKNCFLRESRIKYWGKTWDFMKNSALWETLII